MAKPIKILECLRCGAGYDDPWMFQGCPSCAEAGYNVNLSAVSPIDAGKRPEFLQAKGHLGGDQGEGSLWRYRELLPVGSEHITTLGEGLTPLLKLQNLG